MEILNKLQSLNPPSMWFFVCIVVAFVAYCPFVLFAISRMTGWSLLSKHYGANDDIGGTSWRFQSAAIRNQWLHYGNCLNVTVNQQGLYVVPMIPFRLWHTPLFIPWADCRISRRRIFFTNVVCIHAKQVERVPIMIMEKLATNIRQAIGNAWPEEPK